MGLLDELESLIDELLTLSDALLKTSNERLRQKTPITALLSISMLLGARARSGLRATRALTRTGADDQVAILGRSLAETAIDLFYIRTPTGRSVKRSPEAPRGFVELQPEFKAELFLTYYAISERRLTGQVRPTHAAMLARAASLRAMVPGMRGTYWHGASTTALVAELEVASAKMPHLDRLTDTLHLWRLLSMYAHANPLERPYFVIEDGVPQMAVAFHDSLLILSALLAAAESIVVWAEDIESPIFDKALSIVTRAMQLHGADE